ncbi:MAG: hypothetical protein HY319_03875 [Armatimonadetes bacterium]|nr:hypothetical protein [Armatimonadota bacterium]
MRRHRRLLLVALTLLISAFLFSCDTLGPGVFTGTSQGNTAATVFAGRLLIQPVLFIPEEGRAAVLAERDQLEAAGRRVAEDGSLVIWPDTPAGFWIAQIGDQVVRLDADGVFVFNQIPPGLTQGTLTHPTDSRTVLTFPIDQLTAGPVPDKSLIYPMGFAGACGMNAEEDDLCNGIPPAPRQAEPPAASAVLAKFFPEPTKVTQGPRGSYPLGRELLCEDKNGIFSDLPAVPGFEKEVKYIGSTCDGYVRVGCCINENPFSQAQYNLRLASASLPGLSQIRDALGSNFFLSPPSDFDLDVQCSDNHKGRMCQQVTIGDLSVDLTARGQIVKPADGEVTVEVAPGSREPLTVHNNGCFGITFVSFGKLEIVGELTGNGYHIDVPSDTLTPKPPQVPTPRVEHFQKVDQTVILEPVTDRDLEYVIPENARPGTRDEVLFNTDLATVKVIFVVVAPNTDEPVVDQDTSSLRFEHCVGMDTCPQSVGSLVFTSRDQETLRFVATTPAGSALTINGQAQAELEVRPGGNASFAIAFDCSRTESYNTTITVVVTSVGTPTRKRTFMIPVTAIIKHKAVLLDFPLGPFPAGTEIRLSRIVGGNVSDREGGCQFEHLHGSPFISVDGIHVAEDPNPTGCGFGKIVKTQGGL